MRVVFLEDVSGVALGGDVKEVKNGFARNYLIPKNLAVPVTHNSLQRVERLKKQSGEQRLKELADMRALAEELDGMRVNVEMRAGAGGRLYGSVTNGIVAEELSRLTGREINRRSIEIAEPIRELGMFDLTARLHPDVEARIQVLVYAAGTEPTAEEETSDAEESEAETPPIGEEAAESDAIVEEEITETAPTVDEDTKAEGDADDSQ